MYVGEVCRRAAQESRKYWTPQRTWIAFASPVVTVPVRGAFTGQWTMHDLLTTAGITVVVVAALWGLTFLFNCLRSPALLHSEQQATITELAHRLEQATAEPIVSAHELENRITVRRMITGASANELAVLRYLLQHADVEVPVPVLYQALPDSAPTAITSSRTMWRHQLIRERVELGTNETFLSIISGYRDALRHVLYNP